MTTLTADICPRCGAPVKPKTVGGVCAYCGALLRSASSVDPSAPGQKSESDERIVGLFELGNIAFDAGRADEAMGYFNRVLEARPDISLAWFYKGLLMAGRRPRLEEPTLRAMVSCFEQAVTHAQDAERKNVNKLCTGSAIDFASHLWDGVKPLLGQKRGPVDPSVAGRLIGEIGDALSFAVRHNDDDEQLRRVLALVGDVARHPVRNQLHPVTVEALAALYNSAAEHLRARGRDA